MFVFSDALSCHERNIWLLFAFKTCGKAFVCEDISWVSRGILSKRNRINISSKY